MVDIKSVSLSRLLNGHVLTFCNHISNNYALSEIINVNIDMGNAITETNTWRKEQYYMWKAHWARKWLNNIHLCKSANKIVTSLDKYETCDKQVNTWWVDGYWMTSTFAELVKIIKPLFKWNDLSCEIQHTVTRTKWLYFGDYIYNAFSIVEIMVCWLTYCLISFKRGQWI